MADAWTCERCTFDANTEAWCEQCGTLRDDASQWRCAECTVHNAWDTCPPPCPLCDEEAQRDAGAGAARPAPKRSRVDHALVRSYKTKRGRKWSAAPKAPGARGGGGGGGEQLL